MKTKWILIAVSLVVLAALAVAGLSWVGTVYAQTQNPPYPGGPYGMMGGYGMMYGSGYGPMHPYMVAALAESLDLSPDDVQARIESGQTPWQIAASQGLSDEEISQLMLKAHDEALDKAVDAGLLTKEQADWMDDHMEQMWSSTGSGFGGCHW